MTTLLIVFSLLLLLLLGAGFLLLFRVQRRAEKIIVTQLLASGCVAWLLIMGAAMDEESLYDIGLVFALLAALTTIAFVSETWRPVKENQNHDGS
jgi:multicomponent Na+:H+ antiporter subunit F